MSDTLLLTSIKGMADWALNNMALYGAPIILFLTFIGSLGIPFPVTLVIIAAGAFAREGSFTWWQAGLSCLVGAMLADNSEYLFSRLAGRQWMQRFERKAIWQRAFSTFKKQGGYAIMLTRFWLTPLAPAVNLIAGTRFPYLRFLFFDLIGEFLWVLLYGGLGYLFASQWRTVNETAGTFSLISMVLLVFVFGGVSLAKHLHKHSAQ